MRVLVAGAGGTIGIRLVELLAGRGHHVVATTRSADRRLRLENLGADTSLMDGLDAASVHAAVDRARPDVIVHEMTALTGVTDFRNFDRSFSTTNRLRTEGTDHLLAAAASCGVRRFVAQSYTGWPNGNGGPRLHGEDDPLDEHPAPAQRQSLAAIRHVERAVADAPVHGTVLRYGSLYGPGASDSYFDLVRRRRLPVIGDGGGVWSWLHVDDAATATLTGIEGAAVGIFNICDDEPAPVSQWLPYLAHCLGAPSPLHVPAWLARWLAGDAAVRMMTTMRGSSNATAGRELGWHPRWTSWRDGFRDAAGLTRAA